MRTIKNHVTIRQRPMIRPGTRPIMNSLVMERPTVAPSRIKLVLGGMMGPRMAPEAMTPPARPGLYPACAIMGRSRLPRAAASPTELPIRPAKITDTMAA